MNKRDPYKNNERWEIWKEKNFNNPPKGIKKNDWNLLIAFLKDMELGLNVPKEKKGKRESGTLLNLSSHIKLFLELFSIPLIKLQKQDLHTLEKNIIDGKILKRSGKPYMAFGNYIKDLKVFWNWGLRTGRFKENIIEDISSKTNKPSWIYLTEEQIKLFFNKLSLDYRVYCFFLFDSGMRVTEANSIQIKDFSKDFKQVTISDESAKTFGRTINLKLCSQLVKDFVKENNLKENDYFLLKKPFAINKYLRYHSVKIFGKGISHPKAKGKYENFTMYDIRHNSACYWFNKYPTHKGLMYRFGWRKADKIEYYSEFLGVSDEITDSDMVMGEDKNKIFLLEKQQEVQNKEMSEMKAQLKMVTDLLFKEMMDDTPAMPNQKKIMKKIKSMPVSNPGVYDII